MYRCQLLLSSEAARRLDVLQEDCPFTLVFCRNGLLLTTENAAAFLDWDDHPRAEVPAPGTFRLPQGAKLPFGEAGCSLELDPASERLRARPLGVEPPTPREPLPVERLASPAAHPRPAADRLLRVLAHIGERPALELGAAPPLRAVGAEPPDPKRQKVPAAEALRRAARAAGAQRVGAHLRSTPAEGAVLRIGGHPAAAAPPLAAEPLELRAELSVAALLLFLRASEGAGVFGAIPPLGDFPLTCYLRANVGFRLTVLL